MLKINKNKKVLKPSKVVPGDILMMKFDESFYLVTKPDLNYSTKDQKDKLSLLSLESFDLQWTYEDTVHDNYIVIKNSELNIGVS